ncbi:MAG: hypothetical protein LUB59_06265, partial [Candidatus Gastranaerophilales bacterium]|nr:hypothetical protein [Candidatus Gastranaerophilales bacterium]
MYKETANLTDIKFVLDNLCDETLEELKLMFGEKYKTAAFDEIKGAVEKYIIKLKCTHEPVGVFGLVPATCDENMTTAGIFLLTTYNM